MPLFYYNTTISFIAAAPTEHCLVVLLLTKTAVLSIIVMPRTSAIPFAGPMPPAHSLVYFPFAATLLPSERSYTCRNHGVCHLLYAPYFGMTPFGL